jgi:hypothetical protein
MTRRQQQQHQRQRQRQRLACLPPLWLLVCCNLALLAGSAGASGACVCSRTRAAGCSSCSGARAHTLTAGLPHAPGAPQTAGDRRLQQAQEQQQQPAQQQPAQQQPAQQQPAQQQPPPPQVIPYNPLNRTVIVKRAINLPNSNFPGAVAEAFADYPDPVLENPDGWRFKVISNASIVLGSNNTAVGARIDSIANSKLAPAIALASGNIYGAGAAALLARNGATARPGLQYGVTLAKTDGKVTSSAAFDPENLSKGVVLMLVNQDAVSGQGQTVNLMSGRLEGSNLALGDMRGRSIADRWYLAPSHAVMGVSWDIKGGQAATFSRNIVRASQGSATSGMLHNLHGLGNIPGPAQFRRRPTRNGRKARFLAKHGALARGDNRAYVDAGTAQSGSLQLIKSDRGDSTAVGLTQARTAEGNAIAGALNLVSSENGEVYIGDYWEELSNPGNAVVATK